MQFLLAILLLGAAAIQASPLVVLTGRNDPNLTAQVQNYNLSGNDFTFTLFSVNGVLASGSITGAGFDFQDNGALNTATLLASTNANYSLANGPLAANATGLVATLDFALLTGPNFNGGGNPNQGITPGTFATFTVRDDFGGRNADQIANSIVARFQNTMPGSSDVAIAQGGGTIQSAVPEPASFVLIGAGLIAIRFIRARKARR